MSKVFSKFIMSSVALAGLATALLATAGPAEAARMSCSARAAACERRCAGGGGDWVGCIVRTCNRQYENCMEGADAGGAGLIVPVLLNSYRAEREGPLTPWDDPSARSRSDGHSAGGSDEPSF